MTNRRRLLIALVVLGTAHAGPWHLTAQTPPAIDPLAARVDPYVAKPRIIVLTDIANEPDDQMSMVRFLLYSNELDVEGLVAGTSTWMRNKVRPDVLHALIDAYAEVRPNLEKHAAGYPDPAALRRGRRGRRFSRARDGRERDERRKRERYGGQARHGGPSY